MRKRLNTLENEKSFIRKSLKNKIVRFDRLKNKTVRFDLTDIQVNVYNTTSFSVWNGHR